MKLTIYAKKRTTEEGKSFYTYLTTLTKKNGEEMKVQVKFRQDCGNPRGEDCPMNIIVSKDKANLAEEKYTVSEVDENTGEVTLTAKTNYRLWVADWAKGDAYRDTSLDEFQD